MLPKHLFIFNIASYNTRGPGIGYVDQASTELAAILLSPSNCGNYRNKQYLTACCFYEIKQILVFHITSKLGQRVVNDKYL